MIPSFEKRKYIDDLTASRGLNIRPVLWQNASTNTPPPSTIIVASAFGILNDFNSTLSAATNLDVTITPVTCLVPSDCCVLHQFILSQYNLLLYSFDLIYSDDRMQRRCFQTSVETVH
jgi:hypothetical protein